MEEMILIYRILFVVAVAFFAQQSHSQIYQWVDENGKTHFTDRKPVDPEVEVETIEEPELTDVNQNDIPSNSDETHLDPAPVEIPSSTQEQTTNSFEIVTFAVSALGALLTVFVHSSASKVEGAVFRWFITLIGFFASMVLVAYTSAFIGNGTVSSSKAGTYFFYIVLGLAIIESVFRKSNKKKKIKLFQK